MTPIGPFTGVQVAQIFDVLGLPPQGTTVNTIALVLYPFSNVDSWNPTFNSGDISSLITKIKGQLAVCDTDTATIVINDLGTWYGSSGSNGIRDSEMRINKAASGAEGQVIDDYERRRILRIRIANNLGISVPKDGFLAELESVYGRGLKEFRASGGLGDR